MTQLKVTENDTITVNCSLYRTLPVRKRHKNISGEKNKKNFSGTNQFWFL